MLIEALLGTGALAGGGIAYARMRRSRLYRSLDTKIGEAAASAPAPLLPGNRVAPSFDDRLCVMRDFLPPDHFAALRASLERFAAPERNFVPAHKKGGTVAYETIIAQAPAVAAFYRSPALLDFVSEVTGVGVQPTPLHDQSSLSVLFYDRPGDHIGWHYDHNFYRGRHFTALLPVINEGTADGGLSHATLMARAGGREIAIATPPNSYVLFEGAVVHHKVTPIREGERRLVLSMTFCADPRNHWWQGTARRIKDTAFFGIRALWT